MTTRQLLVPVTSVASQGFRCSEASRHICHITLL
jgi:hypothetical protein